MGLAVLCVRRVPRLGGASMTRDLYEAAMEEWIDDYLDEHPEANWWEAAKLWQVVDAEYSANYIADRTDAAWQKQKDSRI